jgi:hypothetical protein
LLNRKPWTSSQPLAAQQFQLVLGFDAFGNDLQAQRVSQGDGAEGDGTVVEVGFDVGDEGAVDLQVVDREQLEVGERGVAGAEVVDGQRDAHAAQAFENDDGFLRIFHHRAFGDFQFEQFGRQAGGGQRAGDCFAEIAAAQLAGGDVDRDAHWLEAGVDPVLHLAAGVGQHPVADFDDEAGFFGDRDEADGEIMPSLG